MAKLNENYEAVVIFSMKQGEESIKESVERFASLIRDNGTLATMSFTPSTASRPSPVNWRED